MKHPYQYSMCTSHYIHFKDKQSTIYRKESNNSSSMSVKTVKKDGSGIYNLFVRLICNHE